MLLRYRGITMSGRQQGKLLLTDIDLPSTEHRSEYTPRLGADGVVASKQWLGEGAWQWTVATNASSLKEAGMIAGELERAWKDRSVRLSTAPVPLEYSQDGGLTWYRIYGKPGRFSPFTPDTRAMNGVGYMDVEFMQTDPKHYSNVEHTAEITGNPSPISGLTSPLTSPLTTVGSGEPAEGVLVNEGDEETPVRVTFYGPSRNPSVVSDGGMEIGYNGSLAFDEYVELDPMNRTVMLNGTTPVPGRLSLSTRLSSIALPLGSSHWQYRASDTTGTSKTVMSWRDAFTSIQY